MEIHALAVSICDCDWTQPDVCVSAIRERFKLPLTIGWPIWNSFTVDVIEIRCFLPSGLGISGCEWNKRKKKDFCGESQMSIYFWGSLEEEIKKSQEFFGHGHGIGLRGMKKNIFSAKLIVEFVRDARERKYIDICSAKIGTWILPNLVFVNCAFASLSLMMINWLNAILNALKIMLRAKS